MPGAALNVSHEVIVLPQTTHLQVRKPKHRELSKHVQNLRAGNRSWSGLEAREMGSSLIISCPWPLRPHRALHTVAAQ